MGSTQKKKTVQQRRRDTIGQHEKVTTKRKSVTAKAHIAEHAAETVRTSGSKKRRRMNWKEWISDGQQAETIVSKERQ